MKSIGLYFIVLFTIYNVNAQTKDSLYIKKFDILIFREALINIDSITVRKFTSTVTDIQGNQYKTVKIGNQVWMAENLRTTMYNDGSPIIQKNSGNFEQLPVAGTSIKDSGYVYSNTQNSAYGYYYNWYAAKTGKLAPIGWHIPTQAEWDKLICYIQTTKPGYPGLVLKSKIGWKNDISSPGLDVYGFNGLPAGYVYNNNFIPTIDKVGFATYWLSSDIDNNNFSYTAKTRGYSVRCIKD